MSSEIYAVSYTHLDVYKRHVVYYAVFADEDIAAEQIIRAECALNCIKPCARADRPTVLTGRLQAAWV